MLALLLLWSLGAAAALLQPGGWLGHKGSAPGLCSSVVQERAWPCPLNTPAPKRPQMASDAGPGVLPGIREVQLHFRFLGCALLWHSLP